VDIQITKRKSGYAISPDAPKDPMQSDLEHYRSRMVKHLDEKDEANRIFYDALQFAYELHAGQTRKSGAPYISHPCAVAEILARELRFKDPTLLAAALLHDVVEDVPSVDTEDIEQRFGKVVAELVDGCTKLTRHHLDRATLSDLTHSKIFLSASRRLGVLIVKLADRLHNLRTLHYLQQAKRQRIAQETVEVYAPIAARFNIFPLKRELYHLALSYLYPRKSKKILQFIREVRSSSEVSEIENSFKKEFSEASLSVTLRPRPKGLGSYYDPLKRTLDLTVPENYIDFAIILHSDKILDCYSALGIVNTMFAPIPRTMRDFIANPKNNGYRSLHVRVHVGGQNYLIKIRTQEMDQWAQFGVLGEWDAQKPLSDEHWNEISELLRTIGEYGGAGSQRKALIRLSESEEIFAYTPKGDIYYLPKGSIVLDFAYRIHSELGDFCEGALVNGDWSPPTRELRDGDTVEILTSSELLDVDPDLERLCKTPKARTAINKRLQQKRLHYARDFGRQILFQEIERHGLPHNVLEGESTRLMLEFLNLKDLSELFVKLGQDLISPHLVLYYLETPVKEKGSDHRQDASEVPPNERNTLRIEELDKAIHKFARCCNPYPGQEKVVATLSERGTTFHYKDCVDLLHRHDLQPQQLLDVTWERDFSWRAPVVFYLQVLQETVASLLAPLAQISSDIHIKNLEGDIDKNDQPIVRMTVHMKSFAQTQMFFGQLPDKRVIIEDYSRDGGQRRQRVQSMHL
jgi:GTP diphosphokinase / guanosine-3',5'-bis(diphosphate) 3'-diphosphatase